MSTPPPGSLSRRAFCVTAGAFATGAALAAETQSKPLLPAAPARFWEPAGDGTVHCTLCPWGCVVPPGGRGRCRVRENRDGTYVTLVHGRPCSINVDPIEKKPLFHVAPGARALSLATVGCNIACSFCQNWEISQASPEDVPVPRRTPESLAGEAARSGAAFVAYTYSEPTIFYEYMDDIAVAAAERGIRSVVISNGFINAEPLHALLPHLAAVKVDLKAFTEHFYGQSCGGRLAPVLDTLKRVRGAGTWLEIVVLIIPTLNDGEDETRRMAAWLVKELGPDVPVHFTRFHAAYRIRNLPPTPPATLTRMRALAMQEGCRYVYTGNLPSDPGEDTRCHACGALLVDRYGFHVRENRIRDGACPDCGAKIPGVWS